MYKSYVVSLNRFNLANWLSTTLCGSEVLSSWHLLTYFFRYTFPCLIWILEKDSLGKENHKATSSIQLSPVVQTGFLFTTGIPPLNSDWVLKATSAFQNFHCSPLNAFGKGKLEYSSISMISWLFVNKMIPVFLVIHTGDRGSRELSHDRIWEDPGTQPYQRTREGRTKPRSKEQVCNLLWMWRSHSVHLKSSANYWGFTVLLLQVLDLWYQSLLAGTQSKISWWILICSPTEIYNLVTFWEVSFKPASVLISILSSFIWLGCDIKIRSKTLYFQCTSRPVNSQSALCLCQLRHATFFHLGSTATTPR